MTFPNQYWNQEFLDAYLALHPELKTYDAFGFETGYSLSFDFDGGQPPDEERFRALVVDGTNIPESAVTILSYKQTMTWRMRLPSGKLDYVGGDVPAGPVAEKYANVAGPRSVTCSNLDEVDNRQRCNSDPCDCTLQFGAVNTWVCSGAPGCAGHAILRYMVTSLSPTDSDNTVEDIRAYNDWLATATADMTVAESRFPAAATSDYPCNNGVQCYPSVEANVSLTYTGDMFHVTEGFGCTLFRQNLQRAFNLSLSAIDPGAAMYPVSASVCVLIAVSAPAPFCAPLPRFSAPV